jgi:hypothetical protein
VVEVAAEIAGVFEDLRGRLPEFALELHDGKTRLIEFGRYANAKRRKVGAECVSSARSDLCGGGRPESTDEGSFLPRQLKLKLACCDGRRRCSPPTYWGRQIFRAALPKESLSPVTCAFALTKTP